MEDTLEDIGQQPRFYNLGFTDLHCREIHMSLSEHVMNVRGVEIYPRGMKCPSMEFEK